MFVTNKLSDVVVNLSCVNKGFFDFCPCSKLCIAESKVVCQLACTETIELLFSFSKSELIASRRGK